MHLPTPSKLRLFTGGVGLLALVFAVVASASAAQIRSGFDEIGHRQAPQVVATTDLAYALNDMDANLANVLMVGDQNLGPGISAADFTRLYSADRAEADRDLQEAAVRAGSDPAAAAQVRAAMDALGEYEALAGQVMLLDSQHPGRVPGKAPADETALFDRATDLMQNTVVPAAQVVTDTNAAALETAYQSRHGQIADDVLWIVLCGLAVAAVLFGAQLYLVRRTRRLLNSFLIAATALVLGLTVWAGTTLGASGEDLRGAKKDAFDSVKALMQAKAVGTAGNADESRFLADPGRAGQYQSSFLARSRQLADLDGGTTLGDFDSALASALSTYTASDKHPVTFGGYFGSEMRNITFPGEREAAEATLTAFQTYQLDDRRLRQKAQSDLHEAVRFDTSPALADSDGAFVAYSGALDTLIGINQKAFDARISTGLGRLGGWPWAPIGGAVAVVGLTVLGIRPRLAEYR